jgi:glycosyltransferase involved in cell wall biosynthesis
MASNGDGHRLLIVQPYVPAYRQPFFEQLVNALATDGIACRVAGPPARGPQLLRGDEAPSRPWTLPVRRSELPVPGGSVTYTRVTREARRFDGVVYGLAGTAVENYAGLLVRTNRRVGLWGHVKTYVGQANAVDEALEAWQMRRADHVFAYTREGARHAISKGVPSTKVTAVMNAVDVAGLMALKDGISDADLADYMHQRGLHPGKVVGYVGGLDAPKRVDLLAAILDELWALDPEVKLLLGGAGADLDKVEAAVARGQVIPLGHVGGLAKAYVFRSARVILNPGRIGLLAVETLAAGLPIVTTGAALHAPEHEYLVEGESVWTAADRDARSAAALTLDLLHGDAAGSTKRSWDYPTLDDMVRNFRAGVLAMYS